MHFMYGMYSIAQPKAIVCKLKYIIMNIVNLKSIVETLYINGSMH